MSRSGNTTPIRFTRRCVAWLTLACVIAVGPGQTACNRSRAEGPQGPPVMPVKVQKIGSQELGQSSDYTATIKSRNSATIMSDVEGWIFAINVNSGDFVKQGQTLMEIDPRRAQAALSNYDSQLKSKQANLTWAKQQFTRAQAL